MEASPFCLHCFFCTAPIIGRDSTVYISPVTGRFQRSLPISCLCVCVYVWVSLPQRCPPIREERRRKNQIHSQRKKPVLLKAHNSCASALKSRADHKHGFPRERNGQGPLCLRHQCLPIAKEPHHSVTIAIPTVSVAVHHSAYLIATAKPNGSRTLLAAVIEAPTATVTNGVPAAAIGKGTSGGSRQPQVRRAEVGVLHREYPNANATWLAL